MWSSEAPVEAMQGEWNRWAFVRPWLAVVRGRLLLRCTGYLGAPTLGFVKLSVSMDEMRASSMRAVRDALVLLSMIQSVDRRAWLAVLRLHCDVHAMPYIDVIADDGFPDVPFHFEFDNCSPLEEALDKFSRLLADLSEVPSAYFSSTVQKIANMSPRGRQLPLKADAQIQLTINADHEGEVAYAERVHNALRGLVAAHGGRRFPVQATSPSYSMPCGSPFETSIELLPIEVEHYSSFLAPNVAHALQNMIASGDEIAVSRMGMHTCMEDAFANEAAPLVIGKLFERVFCANGCPEKKRVTMDEVRLVCRLDDTAHFRRVCTAIAQSRTTRTIEITFERPDDDDERAVGELLWETVAYALFSKDSRSSISNVVLDSASLTTEEVGAIRQMLSSNDPSSYVFGRRDDSLEAVEPIPGLNFGNATQGTAVTLLDEELANMATCTLENDVEGVKLVNAGAIKADSVNVRVIVPGYGLCSVARDGFVATSNYSQATRITDLTLRHLSVDSSNTLIRFLELVGSSLDSLEIDRSVPFSALFRVCPNLKSLTIRGHFDEENFIQVYEQSQVSITHLKVKVDNPKKLWRALANKKSRLSRSLKHLTCFHDMAEDITVLSDMLKVNRTLEYFELFYTNFGDELQRHHNTLLPVAREPFPIGCRLALLSVFTVSRRILEQHQNKKARVSSSASAVALSKVLADFPVDRHVLSIIFGFAAECMRRRVIVHTPAPRFY